MTHNSKFAGFALIALLAVFNFFTASEVSAQIVAPPRPARKPIKPVQARNESDAPAEKSILTEAKVNVQLCVSDGSVRVNGWDRSEVRAFVSGGSQVGFKVLDKSKQNKAAWLKVLGFDPQTDNAAGADECLSGGEIELDVPRGAIVNLKGQECEIRIDSVAKVRAENVGGNIYLSDISNGIEAKTYEGGVIVGKSAGAMTLLSTTGNIVAFDVEKSDVADVFRAKTSSGSITLQDVAHRQIEVGSNSGLIKYVGAFSSGGQYSLGTTNGSIMLQIPADSSCKIVSSYGGTFVSEMPLKDMLKTSGSPSKLTGVLGGGDCSLNLTTLSGAIRIRKK